MTQRNGRRTILEYTIMVGPTSNHEADTHNTISYRASSATGVVLQPLPRVGIT